VREPSLGTVVTSAVAGQRCTQGAGQPCASACLARGVHGHPVHLPAPLATLPDTTPATLRQPWPTLISQDSRDFQDFQGFQDFPGFQENNCFFCLSGSKSVDQDSIFSAFLEVEP